MVRLWAPLSPALYPFTRIDQRLAREWVYLAVILDAYSRPCVGWALERTLDASLALGALDSALASRSVPVGLVHHSDRGVQYASKAYVDTLKKEGIEISMSRRGNPYDNAKAERFIRTLKYEEVYLYEYESLEEPGHVSATSSTRSTIVNACTQHWTTDRQLSSSRSGHIPEL